MSNTNHWFLTYTGKQVFPLDMSAGDVDIVDIAHSLSNICRFNGHCSRFYSVAQHSVYVAQRLPMRLRFPGLMHDATEAYCSDVIRPIKRMIKGYEEIENRVWMAICERFGLSTELDPLIKEVDCRVLLTEKRDILVRHDWQWTEEQAGDSRLEPYDSLYIRPWKPKFAKFKFLHMFECLMQ